MRTARRRGAVGAAARAAVALLLIGSPGCASTPTSPMSVVGPADAAAWCAALPRDLPVLASPNPDGHEVELLDLYVARWAPLGEATSGVPDDATHAAGRLTAAFSEIRRRVMAGEQLSEVLAEDFADRPDSEVWAAAAALQARTDVICADPTSFAPGGTPNPEPCRATRGAGADEASRIPSRAWHRLCSTSPATSLS